MGTKSNYKIVFRLIDTATDTKWDVLGGKAAKKVFMKKVDEISANRTPQQQDQYIRATEPVLYDAMEQGGWIAPGKGKYKIALHAPLEEHHQEFVAHIMLRQHGGWGSAFDGWEYGIFLIMEKQVQNGVEVILTFVEPIHPSYFKKARPTPAPSPLAASHPQA